MGKSLYIPAFCFVQLPDEDIIMHLHNYTKFILNRGSNDACMGVCRSLFRNRLILLRFIHVYSFLALLTVILWTPVIWAADHTSRQEDDVVRAILDNGLRVIIVPNSLAPVVTTVLS